MKSNYCSLPWLNILPQTLIRRWQKSITKRIYSTIQQSVKAMYYRTKAKGCSGHLRRICEIWLCLSYCVSLLSLLFSHQPSPSSMILLSWRCHILWQLSFPLVLFSCFFPPPSLCPFFCIKFWNEARIILNRFFFIIRLMDCIKAVVCYWVKILVKWQMKCIMGKRQSHVNYWSTDYSNWKKGEIVLS